MVDVETVVARIQEFTKKWPRHGATHADVLLAEGDTDGGFERLLRRSLEDILEPGAVSSPRDLGFGDGRSGMIVPQHECDLILRVNGTLLVIEAKAWNGEVSKDAVFIFLGKILDFLGSPRFDASEPVRCGLIGLSGFHEAARRIMFSFGFVPFSKRGDDMSFLYLDRVLAQAHRRCLTRGFSDLGLEIEQRRGSLLPFLAYEARPITDLVRCERDTATTDLESLRRGTALFDEAREVHRLGLLTYRSFVDHDGEMSRGKTVG